MDSNSAGKRRQQMTGPFLAGSTVQLLPVDATRDAAAWFHISQNPEMHHWTGNTVPPQLADAEALLAHYAEHPDIVAWAIYADDPHRMVGTYWVTQPMRLETHLVSADAQRLDPQYWRSGIIPAARRLVYDWAFTHWAIDAIRASAWEANLNSCCSMEAFAFELVERTHRMNSKYGVKMPQRVYQFSRRTWTEVRRGWE